MNENEINSVLIAVSVFIAVVSCVIFFIWKDSKKHYKKHDELEQKQNEIIDKFSDIHSIKDCDELMKEIRDEFENKIPYTPHIYQDLKLQYIKMFYYLKGIKFGYETKNN